MMANYGDLLAIRKAFALAEPAIREEERLREQIARCEAILAEGGEPDWDRDYTRQVKLEEARKYHADLKAQICGYLRPVHKLVWAQWWDVAKIPDPKPEHETLYAKVDAQARWVADTLKAYLPAAEWAVVEQEQAETVTEEEFKEMFGAEKMPPKTIRPTGSCPSCKLPAVRVRSRCENDTWQVWDRCQECGRNVHGAGTWLPHREAEDLDMLPEVERREETGGPSLLDLVA